MYIYTNSHPIFAGSLYFYHRRLRTLTTINTCRLRKYLLCSILSTIIVAQFDTNFDCRETKQSIEYINDVKKYVTELTDHFTSRAMDLSTLGLGFVINDSSGENLLPTPRKFQHVVSLNLSMNVMGEIGVKFIAKFPNLQILDLSRNCLTSLVAEHRLPFHDLQTLNLSSNLITTVHPFTFSNLSLDTVDLSNNRLIRFCVADYEIHQLFIANNRLTQVEIDSSHHKELQLLNAENNQIRMFRANVDLKQLILANNQLTLDDYFSIRNVYETLDLSRNHIGEFDWKLISCVTNLNLAFNRLTTVKFNCGPIRHRQRMPKTLRLNLDSNHFCSFQQSAANITMCLPKLKFISLKQNYLTTQEKKTTKIILKRFFIESQIYDYEFFPQLDEIDEDDERQNFSIFV